ncbi:MAG TPA: AarF/UbiB family protein [Candidatus Acidoferrum sp.]|nr:AarF/UbiB family protein [Candidatus Acidoferrum sp.]
MLKPKFIPSRLIDPADRKPVEVRPLTRPAAFRGFQVLGYVTAWLARLLWEFLRGRLDQEAYARSVRVLLERMGGLWIKVGQLLSFRIDMFSPELCRELSRLQGQVVGFPPKVARGIVERELGGPIERYFDEWGEMPFAAASIGQIHRAKLRHEQVWVAVKIQRPDLEESCRKDLRIVERVTWLLRLFNIYPFMRWDEGLRELREIMREELDCRYEASAYSRMKKSLKPHKMYVPAVFPRYTTKYILVTEFIHATLMVDFIHMANTDPGKLAVWLQENNINPHVVARRLMQSIFRQLFEDNLYHGDLHPGNIILLRNNRVALIDFGAVAFTDQEYLQKSRLFFEALVTRDYSKAADTAFLLAGALPRIDLEDLKENLVELLRGWGTRNLVRELPYHERSLDNAFVELSKTMFKYRCGVKWALMRLRRATATLDASVVYLYPNVDVNREVSRYIRRAEIRHIQRVGGWNLGPRLMKGMFTAVKVAENAYEEAVYSGSVMRRQAQVFEGTTSKFASLFSALYRQISVAQILVSMVLIAAFLYQHAPDRITPWLGPQGVRFLQLIPYLDYQVWLLIGAIHLYFCIAAFRLGRMFAQKEV